MNIRLKRDKFLCWIFGHWWEYINPRYSKNKHIRTCKRCAEAQKLRKILASVWSKMSEGEIDED